MTVFTDQLSIARIERAIVLSDLHDSKLKNTDIAKLAMRKRLVLLNRDIALAEKLLRHA